jgi:hypothetical protein
LALRILPCRRLLCTYVNTTNPLPICQQQYGFAQWCPAYPACFRHRGLHHHIELTAHLLAPLQALLLNWRPLRCSRPHKDSPWMRAHLP